MRTANKSASNLISRVDRSSLTNNTQKVLLALVNTPNQDGWVARTSLRVPSVGSRLRDLRKPQFGGFQVECASASELNKRPSSVTKQQTFYRIVPRSVTVSSLKRALKGVI